MKTLTTFTLLVLLHIPTTIEAQDDIQEISFDTIPTDTSFLGSPAVGVEGDLIVSGAVESADGYVFPDGTIQVSAAESNEGSQSANSGLYSNRIALFVPPEPYTEICYRDGVLTFEIHAVSESTAGGSCAPGDIGWVFERFERSGGADLPWFSAKSQCLKDGMRLPEAFEWQVACDNDGLMAISDMKDDWEFSSNESVTLLGNTNTGIAGPIMGNGSCGHASWVWIGNSAGSSSSARYRCVR